MRALVVVDDFVVDDADVDVLKSVSLIVFNADFVVGFVVPVAITEIKVGKIIKLLKL